MNIDRIIENSKKEIKFDIKYKTESTFMKFLDSIMFFNKNFRNYITTISSTIYFPNKEYFSDKPLSSISTLLHELVHIHDRNRMSFPVFAGLYLSPQVLVFLVIPLLFILPIKLCIIAMIVLLLPLPALGRAWLEYRAYCMSIYVTYKLSQIFNVSIDFKKMNNSICEQFISSQYYFMLPFKSFVLNKFNNVVEKCLKGHHPFEDKIFVMADKILEKH